MKKSNLILSALTVTLLSFAASIPAHAHGGGSTGGGDEEVCNGGVFNLFLDHSTQLTDLRANDRDNDIPSAYIGNADEEIIRETILSFLDQNKPDLAKDLRNAFNHITFVPVDSVENIDTGADISAAKRIFMGCSRRMIAVQDFDTPSAGYSRVRLVSNPQKLDSDYDKFYPLDQAYLKFHEAFIYLASSHTQNVKEMETEARKRTADLSILPGLNGYVLLKVRKKIGADTNNMLELFLPELKSIFKYSLNNNAVPDLESVQTEIDEMLDAGLDPNAELNQCHLPLLAGVLVSTDMPIWQNSSAGGETPIFAFSNDLIALSLVRHGAKIDSKTPDGETLLHLAAGHVGTDLVEAMVERGADVNAPWCSSDAKEGSYAKTPLDIAKKYGSFSDRFLKKHGAKSGKALGLTCPIAPKNASAGNTSCFN